MAMNSEIAALFLDYSVENLTQMRDRLASCLDKITEQQVWQKSGAHENSIGNLVLHLCGNMRQWILHGVGGQIDVRTRDAEFAATDGLNRTELLAKFDETVLAVKSTIAQLPHQRLTEIINPQHGEVSVLAAIYHVVAHVEQHVGQIVLLTKQMVAQDLDLTIPRKR